MLHGLDANDGVYEDLAEDEEEERHTILRKHDKPRTAVDCIRESVPDSRIHRDVVHSIQSLCMAHFSFKDIPNDIRLFCNLSELDLSHNAIQILDSDLYVTSNRALLLKLS